MSGEAMLSTFLAKEVSEHVASVLTTMVRAKYFDFCIVLSARPSYKGLIGVEGLIFGAQDVNVRELGVIICERDVISLFTETCYWGWSPEVSMDLITETFCWWGFALFEDNFVCHLHILT